MVFGFGLGEKSGFSGFGQGEKSGFDMGSLKRKKSRGCVCDGGSVRGSGLQKL